MKRFSLVVVLMTFVGLAVVYGEVEAVKTGYEIRKLNLKKMELANQAKLLEFQIATLKTPQRLEQWMGTSRLNLTHSKTMTLVRAETPESGAKAASERASRNPIQIARLFLGIAQADSER